MRKIQLVVTDCVCMLLVFLNFSYNAQTYVLSHCNIILLCKFCDSHALCASSCIHALACTYVSMLLCFPVWCSALRTDSQSNALTSSICSMVTSLMVVSYICGCKLLMILVMLPMQFKVRRSMVRSPHLWLSCRHPVVVHIAMQ